MYHEIVTGTLDLGFVEQRELLLFVITTIIYRSDQHIFLFYLLTNKIKIVHTFFKFLFKQQFII